jgi:hypothetical protein
MGKFKAGQLSRQENQQREQLIKKGLACRYIPYKPLSEIKI